MIHSSHRGLFSLFNMSIVTFSVIAIILAVIIINVGFVVIQGEKKVVSKAVDEVDNHLMIAGKISASADILANELTVTATPIRTASAGSVKVDPQILKISYELIRFENTTITYEDIYAGTLQNDAYNVLENAVADAKKYGLIDFNPYVDEHKPTNTVAFIYWIINQNFDMNIDSDELAILAIVYAKKDRPSTGEYLVIQANVGEGYILKMEREIPNISGSMMNFGGKLNGP